METTRCPAHWLPEPRIPDLLREFGSPLHVYDENTLRTRLGELRDLLAHRPWHPSISAKANGNPHLLSLAREEGLHGDAMSPGEILLLEEAGFPSGSILFIPNNVAVEEFEFAARRGVLCSLDSLDQVRSFASRRIAPRVALRLDPGVGDGHHPKVVTAGNGTKFGILPDEIPEALGILEEAGIRPVGLGQHIGSGFLEPSRYLEAAGILLEIARTVPSLEFVDFGGGFGIPYRPGQPRLDLGNLGRSLDDLLSRWCAREGRRIEARIEPGRYWCAEGGCLLGTVHAVKRRGNGVVAGTDIGFNVLQRPVLYDAWHGIDLVPAVPAPDRMTESVTWVGNICESGDILGAGRRGPLPVAGDSVRVRDTGAYGASMSSTYNARPLPAEVLLRADGSVLPVRRAGRVGSLLSDFPRRPLPAAAGDPPFLPRLRERMAALARSPVNRLGSDFHEEHLFLVERFVRETAPLFGADLSVVLPAAILHDSGAMEDFDRLATHHETGARRAEEILLEEGCDAPTARRVADCCRMHLVPVDPGEHGPEAACLSHADALAQMANPAFWLHYAGKVRGLGFREGRDWYANLLRDRRDGMSESVRPLAAPLLERALEVARASEELFPSPS